MVNTDGHPSNSKGDAGDKVVVLPTFPAMDVCGEEYTLPGVVFNIDASNGEVGRAIVVSEPCVGLFGVYGNFSTASLRFPSLAFSSLPIGTASFRALHA